MEKMRVLLVILLLTVVSAGMDPHLVEESSLSVVEQGYVRAVGGELTSVNMNVSVPANTDYQTSVINMPTTKVGINPVVHIVENNPSNPLNYNIVSSVTLKARRTTYLPQTYQLGSNEMLYTHSTARIQSNDPEIISLARSITANSSDDFEKIAKLSSWVNSHVTYDISMMGKLKDAKWVLENRRGVCEEYATLFVAFARSISIPARIVSGMSYDESAGVWSGHAWAEAYIGKWVPVDPTWNEVGHLDATHLEFSKLFDNETIDNVFAYVSGNARLEWSEPNPQEQASVSLLSSTEGEKRSDYTIQAAATTLGSGENTLVFAVLSSQEYSSAELTLTPCRNVDNGGSILNVEDGERTVILEPNKTTVVSWVVSPVSGLVSNYIYTCPLIINSEYFSPNEFEVKVNSAVKSINFNAFAEKNELQLGENQTLYVDIGAGAARTYSGTIYLTSDDSLYSQPITRSGRYSFVLQPKEVGLKRVYLTTSLGGAKEIDYEVTVPGGIGVEVSSPQAVLLGSDGNIYVNLTSSQTNKNVRITASAGGYEEAKEISLTGNQTVEFSLTFNDSQVQNITVTVESGDFRRDVVEPVVVYTLPQINFTQTVSDIGNGSMRVDLSFSGIEDAGDMALTIDGMQVPLTDGNASVILTQGTHKLMLQYSDLGGDRRTYTADLQVQSPYPWVGGLETSTPSELLPLIGAVLCLSFVIIVVLVLLILRKIGGTNKAG